MVKLYRDEPEFIGGPLTAEVPEESVAIAIDNGWKVAEAKPVKKEAEKPAEVPEVKEEEKPLKSGKKKLD